jgi:hypothetical protein
VELVPVTSIISDRMQLDHLRLIPDGDVEILAQSRGEVTSDKSIDPKTFSPSPDGPISEHIFGRLFRCACGNEDARAANRREFNRTRLCEACGKPEPRNERSERFGHIVLPFPIAHPLFSNDPSAPRLAVVPVLPPGLRVSATEGEVTRRSDVEVLCSHLVRGIHRLRRCREVEAPPEVIEWTAARIEQRVRDLFFRQLMTWGSGGVFEYLRTLDAAVGRGEVSLRDPGDAQPQILRMRGLALGLVSRVPEPAQRVETYTVVLRTARTAAELLASIAGDTALRGMRCHAEDRVVIGEAPGLVVRAELIGDPDAVATWSQKLGYDRDGAVMVVRVEFMLDERYRGEQWDATNGFGRVFYRTSVEVMALAKVLESIEGATIVDLQYSRFFRQRS